MSGRPMMKGPKVATCTLSRRVIRVLFVARPQGTLIRILGALDTVNMVETPENDNLSCRCVMISRYHYLAHFAALIFSFTPSVNTGRPDMHIYLNCLVSGKTWLILKLKAEELFCTAIFRSGCKYPIILYCNFC